jgi:isopentenyl-diphosphate delta-isomerase
MEKVVLVDEQDREIGAMEKLEAHQKGKLHRAISIFIFDDEGRTLIHQRASGKYHSPSLWTNTACSHPRPGEQSTDAANRRLQEEMGISTDLNWAFNHLYRASFDNGLIEHELDHCFYGFYKGVVFPDPEEVQDYRWIDVEELRSDIEARPDSYTVWFQQIFPRMHDHLRLRINEQPA